MSANLNVFVTSDCFTCGAECNRDTKAPNQACWARKHARDHDGHLVVVETKKIRVYGQALLPEDVTA